MRAQVANIKKQLEDADLFSIKLMIVQANEKVRPDRLRPSTPPQPHLPTHPHPHLTFHTLTHSHTHTLTHSSTPPTTPPSTPPEAPPPYPTPLLTPVIPPTPLHPLDLLQHSQPPLNPLHPIMSEPHVLPVTFHLLPPTSPLRLQLDAMLLGQKEATKTRLETR